MLRRLVLASALGLLAGVPFSMADTLPTVADSQVNLTAVAARGGALPTLMVKNTLPGPSYRTFARFDLSALASGLPVTKATLRVWTNLVTTEGDVDVVAVLGPWDETSLTAVIAPTLSIPFTSFSVTKAKQKTYINADVTDLVSAWVSGDLENNGLALLGGTDEVNVRFDSKESLQTSHPMELEVVLGLPPGSGDITGVSPGFGLTGGGNLGNITLSVNSTTIQRRVTGFCNAGSSIRGINDTGTVTCEPDDLGSIVQVFPIVGFAGSVPGGSAAYVFIGPTASFTLPSTEHVTGSAVAPLGLASGSATTTIGVGLCYQAAAGGNINNFAGPSTMTAYAGTARLNYSAAASVTLNAGSWKVGMCVQNIGPAAITNTGNVNGWFLVSN